MVALDKGHSISGWVMEGKKIYHPQSLGQRIYAPLY